MAQVATPKSPVAQAPTRPRKALGLWAFLGIKMDTTGIEYVPGNQPGAGH